MDAKTNIKYLMDKAGLNPTSLATALEKKFPVDMWVPQATIFRIVEGITKDPRTSSLSPIADFFKVSLSDLRSTDLRSAEASLPAPDMDDGGLARINYYAAKGSCGGGAHNEDAEAKGQLIKELGFFKKYNVKPENLAAIYADGSSMADFIVDGDMVIIDKTKTEPQSGKIFAIQHPDGLRIKQLRREIDGTWVLESRNPDKRAYPDERITPDNVGLLKILGRFVYRQGG
ncbi:S24 family peptidase [Undibacterium sp. TJN19]|uniref:S24 family peptidase n=1 Tax=Undibacterium sp. TJN19 TaxID=3413055 RepID=UPI003BF29511